MTYDDVRRDAGGYWLTQKAPAVHVDHRCDLPAPDHRTGPGSVWQCSRCQMKWTLRYVPSPPDLNPLPTDRAQANRPWMKGPDGSLWVAFGRRNRRIARRLARKGRP